MADEKNRIEFTKEMKKEYTILTPNMAPIHFELIKNVLRSFGYKVELLRTSGREIVDEGLKYVHNDTCYPALLSIGQLMHALHSGKYDLHKVALVMTQTGGGCRASNYIAFIRRALKKAGMEQIPVISLNLSGLESNPGFKLTLPLIRRIVYSAVFGDILMKCVYRMRPYELEKGIVNRKHKIWEQRVIAFVTGSSVSHGTFKKMCREMVHDFDTIPISDEKKPRVGIVGEILVKFLPAANNHLADLLEAEGAEPVVPDLIDFICYCFYNQNFKVEKLGFKKSKATIANLGLRAIDWLRKTANEALEQSRHFTPAADIRDLAKMAAPIVSAGNQTGEGWFLTGEMMELIHGGIPNIVCIQPFGCLPNHIVGKGVIKEVRREHPEANIVAIDYDPGASEVNQLNRIKLMLSTAQKNLHKDDKKDA